MTAEMRPWTVELLKLVRAGVSEREELIKRATPFVPQGFAWRTRENLRLWEQRRNRPAEPTRAFPPPRERSAAEIHKIGSRVILRASLRDLELCGHIYRDGNEYRPTNGHKPA